MLLVLMEQQVLIQKNKMKICKSLYDTIVEHIPAPVDNREEPLQFQVALLDYNDYVGRIGIGRVFRGTMQCRPTSCFNEIRWYQLNNSVYTKLFGFFGLKRIGN